jgi:hypothetical protein
MDIIFIKPGKYKNDVKILVIKESDVESRKVFSVVEENAMNYVKAGCAKLVKAIKADPESSEKFKDDTPKKPAKKVDKK